MSKSFFYDGLKGRDGIGDLRGDGEQITIEGPGGDQIEAISFKISGKRQEVVETRKDKYFKLGEEVHVGYYMYLPEGSGIGYGTLGSQFHTRVSDGESPYLTLRDRSEGITIEANGTSLKTPAGKDGIFIGHLQGGKWYRVIMRSVAGTSSGEAQVWIHDGEKEKVYDLEIRGGTMGKGSVKGELAGYIKFGLYYIKNAKGEAILAGAGVCLGDGGFQKLAAALPMSGQGSGGGDDDGGGGDPGGDDGGGGGDGDTNPEEGSAINKTFDPVTLPRINTYKVSGKNVDAIAGGKNGEGKKLVFITGKNNDRFSVSDFGTGKELESISIGSPNGLIVFGDEIHVTTTEGERAVHVFDLDTLEPLYKYAGGELTEGEHDVSILINKLGEKVAYLTDDSGRVLCYSFSSGSVFWDVETGIKSGLEEIEAIALPENQDFDYLVVADENRGGDSAALVYKVGADGIPGDPEKIGKGLFKADAEGIVHLPAPDGRSGYCIITDQRKDPGSQFHIWHYDPAGFTYQGYFMVEGVTNTDGISAIDGVFLAIDNDTEGAAASLDLLFAKTGLGWGESDPGGGGGNGGGGDEKTYEDGLEDGREEIRALVRSGIKEAAELLERLYNKLG